MIRGHLTCYQKQIPPEYFIRIAQTDNHYLVYARVYEICQIPRQLRTIVKLRPLHKEGSSLTIEKNLMTRLQLTYLKLRCICLLIGLCFSPLLIESAKSSDFTIHVVEKDRLITKKQNEDSLNLIFTSSLVNELSNIGFNIIEINANDRVARSKSLSPKNNDRHNLNLTVYTRFIRMGENQFIPSMELIADKNNRTLASIKTIPLRTSGETHSLHMQVGRSDQFGEDGI